MRYPLALGLAVVLAACSGGGGSSVPAVPNVPWGNFRHDNSNSAASGAINQNKGNVTLVSRLANSDLSTSVTLSTPTIDHSNNLVVGTANGVMSLTPDGAVRWMFDACVSPENPPNVPLLPPAVGSVTASPTVTPGGEIVFGSDGTDGQPGGIYAIKDRGTYATCTWYFQPPAVGTTSGIKSSAVALIDTFDLSLLTVYVGSDDGRLRALNSDGTVRWTYPTGATAGPITSTPAIDSNNSAYVVSADGLLSGIDFSGRPLPHSPASLGAPPAQTFQPSPAIGTDLYAIGSGASLFALNPDLTRRWQYTPPLPIAGSPAYLIQSFGFEAQTVVDTIVYVVDTQGTAYGLRDGLNGAVMQVQRCSTDLTQDCHTDSCLPAGGTCNSSTHRCSISGQTNCTQDSCVVNNNGTCEVTPGIVSVADAPVTITTSAIVSGDLFVVIGTPDGRVCARALDGFVPGQSLFPLTPTWAAGNCSVTTSQACQQDSDCPTGETCEHRGCIALVQNTLAESISATATSIPLANANDFPSAATVSVDDESISYTDKSGNTLTGVTRGVNGTTPAAHDSGAIVADVSNPTRSSPIIGVNGNIYVTTDAGLYVIK